MSSAGLKIIFSPLDKVSVVFMPYCYLKLFLELKNALPI
jgi:hypothetical protein